MLRSIFFIAFTIAIMVNEAGADDLIDCCSHWDDCRTYCNSQHCKYTVCCKHGPCTVDGAAIPVCGCARAKCPNRDLVASGLLGSSKFIDADEKTIKSSMTDSLNVTKN
uniref:Uncharacterized protein n=1 Tax=Panagrolaimus sp. PS1159 TaxID=55785 RepID=A0AC35FCT3_9BILA